MCIIWISLGARSVTALYLRQWLTHARDVWMSHVTMGYLFKCQSSQRVFCDHLNVSASTTWMSRTLFKWHSTYSNVCHLNEYSVIIWMSPPPPFKCHAPYLNVVHTLFKCDSSYSNEVHLIVRMSLNVHPSHVCHPNEYPVLIIRMSLNMHHSSVCHPNEYPVHVNSVVQIKCMLCFSLSGPLWGSLSFTCLSSEWVSCAHHQNVSQCASFKCLSSEYASLKCLSSEGVSWTCHFWGTAYCIWSVVSPIFTLN